MRAVSIVAGAALAAATLTAALPKFNEDFDALVKRQSLTDQSSYIPALLQEAGSSCQSSCVPLSNQVQTCANTANGSTDTLYSCACSGRTLSSAFQCARCILSDTSNGLGSLPLEQYNGFLGQCAQLGYKVKTVPLGGADASSVPEKIRSSPSAAAAAGSTQVATSEEDASPSTTPAASAASASSSASAAPTAATAATTSSTENNPSSLRLGNPTPTASSLSNGSVRQQAPQSLVALLLGALFFL